MNPDIRVSNDACYMGLRIGRRRQAHLSVDGSHLRRSRTDDSERKGVPARIAALKMSESVAGRSWRLVVFMGREPMVMLRMVVICVGVSVQRASARHRDQRRDEQRSDGAVH
jgi:hypothetical protein